MFKFQDKKRVLWASFVLFLAVVVYISCNSGNGKKQEEQSADMRDFKILADDVFAGEESCKSCHQQEYDRWKESHHFRAMEKADSASVLGDFNNVTFINKDGMKSTFYVKDGKYMVNTEGGDGKNHDYEIVYTFGFTPLQQYIIEFPKRRFQCLTTAWDTEKKKWFNLYPDLHVVHSEWLHQSKGAMTWNTMCADCHSTNVRKNFHEEADSFNTKYSIINVSCEACHGPGKDHVERMKKDPSAKYDSSDFLMTKATSAHNLTDQCARCHVRREQFTPAYNYEGTFFDHYFPQLLTEGVYHADGQILDEVYVYGSFLQSKMYLNHVKCVDCHEPHSMKLKLAGNALCGQCHNLKKYDNELHTFHAKETEASKCVNCHMTGRYYMVNDFRRDHSFRIPRPDLSIKYGTPNACNNCHNDKTGEWTWENYKKWYGEIDSLHNAEILAMGRTGDTSAIAQLVGLTEDDKQSPMARATAVTYLGRYADDRSIQAILLCLNDKEPLVRGASVDALSQLNLDQAAIVSLLKLLNDSKRTIRVKAFNALAWFPERNVPLQYREPYLAAKVEFMDYLATTADFSGGQTNKAMYLEKKGETDAAIKAYERAIRIDNHNNVARSNLANLYYGKKEFEKAERAFREVIEQEPEFGQTYYSLGLLLAESKRFEEAVEELKKAGKYMPGNARVRYNLGLIYQNLGKYELAESTFKEGLMIDPRDEGLLYALFYFYSNVSPDKAKAREYIDKLVEYYPENGNYGQIAEEF